MFMIKKNIEGNLFGFTRCVSKVTAYLAESGACVPHNTEFFRATLSKKIILIREL